MSVEPLPLPMHLTRGKRLAAATPVIVSALLVCAVLLYMANGVKLYGLAAVLGLLLSIKLLIAWFIVRPAEICLEADAITETTLPFAWYGHRATIRHEIGKFDRVEAIRLDFLPGLVTVFIVILRGKEKKDDLVMRPPRGKFMSLTRAAEVGSFVKRLAETYHLKAVSHA